MNAYQSLIRKMIGVRVPFHWKIYHQENGFIVDKAKELPISSTSGRTMLHRFVVWDHLGEPKISRCSVCNQWASWESGRKFDGVKVIPMGGDCHSTDPQQFTIVCGWCQFLSRHLEDRFQEVAGAYLSTQISDRPDARELVQKHIEND